MKAITETGKTIRLEDKNEIKRGGEGKILTIPEMPKHVAKVYLDKNYQHMSLAQKDALQVLDPQVFVKPLELIFDKKDQKNIIGFTMDYLGPDFIPLSALFSKNFCQSNQIDEKQKTELARKLIKALAFAHQHDIIIGDLSGLNIMVNLQGELRFLDVDSYETPVHSHWGLLFDEIRDYLYQGKVSAQSDYFALAVIIFNLFTHLHPFKGIHKKYRGMAERMVRKLPVFVSDPELIIPKCYQAIQNPSLQSQFQRIFQEGERFLLNIDQVLQSPKARPQVIKAQIQSRLKYQEVYQLSKDDFILQSQFTQNKGLIETPDALILLDLSNHGYAQMIKTFDKSSPAPFQWDQSDFFLGDQNFLVAFQGKLFLWESDSNFRLLSNFQASPKAQFFRIDSILVVLDQGYMRHIYLDQVLKDQIHIEQQAVFTAGFDPFNGFIQNAGGVQYLFYHSGQRLSTLPSPQNLQSVFIRGNTGIISYEKVLSGEKSLRHEYFSIEGLKLKKSGVFLPQKLHFALKGNAPKGLIFEAQDDGLRVRRSQDFQIVGELECSILSTESILHSTQAGIIAQEKNFCYLLNTQ